MPEKRENKLYSLKQVALDVSSHDTNLANIETAIGEIHTNYNSEIAKIEENFDVFGLENQKTYERYEADFTRVLEYIDQEYFGLFKALDEDFVAHRQKLESQLAAEDEQYQKIVKAFEDLENDAYSTYQTLCQESEATINKETEIHQRFVDEQTSNFEAIKDKYNFINNNQYDKLLWTMEKSKNALNQLSKQLNEQAFNDTKYMNQTVLNIIEQLRDTKNKITALFKTTTQAFTIKKDRIDELSTIRQIPYSEINQTLIDQYVRQITSVNQKKIAFDKLVNEDYLKSSMIVGKRIIDADSKKNQRLTKKFIMQYGIIKAKSNYLLKRNQQLSDLLISKYQNEIRKIKVDSFKRVEEIKLAYSLPSHFFQNSINLYSNFAFYVSESLDELDNMLSDLLRFNQNITQTFVDYMTSSTKAFEDYKINCQVTVNNITSKMTDLLTNINRFSKDIVSLESKNRLEIADIKKQMENADITGDYQKYLATLNNDRSVTDFQHTVNIKKTQVYADGEASLLVIQREVTERNRQRQIDQAALKHERLINNLEKDIHDLAYDKELAICEARYRRDLALIDQEQKQTLENEAFFRASQQDFLWQTLQKQLAEYEHNKAVGSDYVVDFVHQTQKIIDVEKSKTLATQAYLLGSKLPYAYAYHLELEREEVKKHLLYRTSQKTEPYEKAIQYFDHLLFVNRKNIIKQIGRYSLYLKHLLANLSDANAPIQAESLSLEHFYRYEVLSVIRNSRETVSSLISPEKNADLLTKADKLFDDDFKRVAILTTSAEKKCLMNVKSIKGLRKSLLGYYVEMILLLDAFLEHVYIILDELEECLIKNDVLTVKKYQDEMNRKKLMIDMEYDLAVFHAGKQKTKADKAIIIVNSECKAVENRLAARVYQLNKTYIDGLKEQEKFIDYLDQELSREYKKQVHSKTIDLKQELSTFKKQKQTLDNNQKRYIYAYEVMKKQNYSLVEQANKRAMANLDMQDKQRAEGLITLNQTIETLPKKNDQMVSSLELQKEQFVKSHSMSLTHELAHIEEQKFISRPAFLTKIAEIRDRLPQDYMTLYKQIAIAQTTFVKQYPDAHDLYSMEYNRFLNSQTEYNNILFNDSIILHPFEKYLHVSDRIKIKTDEVFQDTVKKSAARLDEIKKQAIESEENQKRIINA